MTTKLQKLIQTVEELSSALEEARAELNGNPEGCQIKLVGIAKELKNMEPEVSKLATKAAETDPDKRTYGQAMVAKVFIQAPPMDISVNEAM